jgi:hypothetical protein
MVLGVGFEPPTKWRCHPPMIPANFPLFSKNQLPQNI